MILLLLLFHNSAFILNNEASVLESLFEVFGMGGVFFIIFDNFALPPKK
jgi:hypothetical protein